MNKSYKMIKDVGECLFIEKKSKFISHVSPVYREEDAVEFINAIKKKHYNASHNCYAYIIGESSNIQRSSDDGEPSGTAGNPILETIRKENLTNTIIVVTRYFGGIMLGAGGLIRAYTESAVKGIRKAGTVIVKPFSLFKVSCDYTFLSKLQYEIPKNDYIISNTEYIDIVHMDILIDPKEKELFNQQISQWTNGTSTAVYDDTVLIKMDVKN